MELSKLYQFKKLKITLRICLEYKLIIKRSLNYKSLININDN